MEALKLTRKEYTEGLEHVALAAKNEASYLDRFIIEFPDGINTAGTIEICRAMQNPSMEAKISLMRICLQKKNVTVTCPNGEKERFCMSNIDDNLEAFPLFKKEPLALMAIADCLYGHILKKYVRL